MERGFPGHLFLTFFLLMKIKRWNFISCKRIIKSVVTYFMYIIRRNIIREGRRNRYEKKFSKVILRLLVQKLRRRNDSIVDFAIGSNVYV